MNPKITPDHLGRGAAVYVRQSTMGQVAGNTESRRRQYALVDAARAAGFASIAVIDDDLGRSGSGLTERPGVPEAGGRGLRGRDRGRVLPRGLPARPQRAGLASPD
jgi:hypothetical protein